MARSSSLFVGTTAARFAAHTWGWAQQAKHSAAMVRCTERHERSTIPRL